MHIVLSPEKFAEELAKLGRTSVQMPLRDKKIFQDLVDQGLLEALDHTDVGKAFAQSVNDHPDSKCLLAAISIVTEKLKKPRVSYMVLINCLMMHGRYRTKVHNFIGLLQEKRAAVPTATKSALAKAS